MSTHAFVLGAPWSRIAEAALLAGDPRPPRCPPRRWARARRRLLVLLHAAERRLINRSRP